MKKVLIVGGDRRNIFLAGEFKKRGVSVLVCGLDRERLGDNGEFCEDINTGVSEVDCIILPIPMSKDGEKIHTPLFDKTILISDIISNAKKGTVIFGGMVHKEMLENPSLEVFDYAKREEFAALNAIPTAEAAIEAVMKVIPTTIYSSNVIVTGFGRVGKVLSLTLKAMGANVRVCARSSADLSLASALGLKSSHLDDMHHYLPRTDIVFNTIPKRIFFARELNAIREHIPFADVASAPGGLEPEEAKSRGINYMFLPSLPGKYSPLTGAQIIFQTITNIITESGKEENIWIFGGRK